MKKNLDDRLCKAVAGFWGTRSKQGAKQGSGTGLKDYGSRSEVTGGAQMDGFVALVAEIVHEAGITNPCIYRDQRLELPGFFRPTKEWDLLVVVDGQLLACCEFKSQVGSFGNNFNNRTEEAIGTATDLWTAFREGAFKGSPRPWLGWIMLLEKTEKSTTPVGVKEPHFPVFPEFKQASYAKRYELLCLRLVRERLYDSACLLLTDRDGPKGHCEAPNEEISFARFAASLAGHATAFANMKADWS